MPHQAQAPGPDRGASGEGRRWDDGPTPTPTAWAELEQQHDQIRRGADRNPGCEADDGLCPTLGVVGETRCALHLGWPLCPGCREQAHHARIAAALPATGDGTCPGHHGPCGRAAMPGDPHCARWRVASQRDRDRVVREWEAVRYAAKAQEAPDDEQKRVTTPQLAGGEHITLDFPQARRTYRVERRRQEEEEQRRSQYSLPSPTPYFHYIAERVYWKTELDTPKEHVTSHNMSGLGNFE